MVGITNMTNVSMTDINEIINVSSLPRIFIKVNTDVYGGWFFFIMLALMWFILFYASMSKSDQIMQNAMYSGAAITLLTFVLRGIYIVREGAIQGMLTDFQLWIFPIVTALIAVFVWATKD